MKIKEITKIFIIESPSKDDIKESRIEGQALSQILNLTRIQNDYFFVESVTAFNEVLNKISIEVESEKEKYGSITLHFSMHGNEIGIAFTSGESITWAEFYTIIKCFNDSLGYIPLNRKLPPVNLNFSVCKGFYATTIREMGNESSYQILVGPKQSIDWADSILAFAVYYHTTLHKEKGSKVAVERMNLINDFEDVFCLDLADGLVLNN